MHLLTCRMCMCTNLLALFVDASQCDGQNIVCGLIGECHGAGTGSEPPGSSSDEPEAAVLLIACAIGLVTGGGVVLFNGVIHSIRHLAFQVWCLLPPPLMLA